jgi:hypothetical protein
LFTQAEKRKTKAERISIFFLLTLKEEMAEDMMANKNKKIKMLFGGIFQKK